jgi:hypothetical protein
MYKDACCSDCQNLKVAIIKFITTNQRGKCILFKKENNKGCVIGYIHNTGKYFGLID